LQFSTIKDVLTAVDEVESYWELDACGRVRVLMKLASRFARKIEILTAFVVIAPQDELNIVLPNHFVIDRTEEAKQKRDIALMLRVYREWGGTARPGELWCRNMVGLPCLRIDDPEIGEVVIETSGSGLLLGKEKTEAFSGIQFGYGNAGASLPQWSDYEKSCADESTDYPFPDKGYLHFLFVDPEKMKKCKITYRLCENWTNHAKTRKVIQSVYDYCSNSKKFATTIT